MATWTALTTLNAKKNAQDIADALEAIRPAPAGVGVFEIEDQSGQWEVGGYFTEKPDDIALTILAVAHGAAPFAVSKIPPTDWVAHVRRELAPVRAGRFLIHGAHDSHVVRINDIPLRIEAAMAFGTGHHATTVGCLLALQTIRRSRQQPRNIADIGCGTGVLAIAAAKLWRSRTLASDIDPVATATARVNATANSVAPILRVVTAAGFDTPALRNGPPFDIICANILARPLRKLAPAMALRCRKRGTLILSGLLNTQAKAVEATYRAWGFRRAAHITIGEWTTLTLSKI